jgi:hypothetical protein
MVTTLKVFLNGEDMMSLERAILLVVGATVLITVLLGVFHSIYWLWITALLGAHLVQASFTGFARWCAP